MTTTLAAGNGPKYFYENYHDARSAAQHLANAQRKEVGLEKFNWLGRNGYRVFNLPKPENRYGFELRCETVSPSK